MVRRWLFLGLYLLVALWGVRADATPASYVVDGGCASSGTGLSLTCGASGPFKTISEGITAMQPGDTLNIRGVHATHGSCPGSTDGVYTEYVGIWGTSGDLSPGKALTCLVGSPCVVQGCDAATCGTDETATIAGWLVSTDWTDAGGGIWSHAVSARTEWTGGDVPANNTNPNILAQGTSKTLLQYGTSTAPTEGHWYYSTGVVYVNPTGTGNPNTDADTALRVPDLRALLIIDRQSTCPSSVSCPATSYVTFRRLNVEGTRWSALGIYANGTGNWQDHLTFDTMTVQYAPRFGMHGGATRYMTLSNLSVNYIGRGVGISTGGAFAVRFGHADNTTLTNLTMAHLGTAGTVPAVSALDCQWCDSPWNVTAQSSNAQDAKGNGLDIKQSDTWTVNNVTCVDASSFCIQVDVSHDVTVDTFTITRARYGVVVREYTPDNSSTPIYVRNYNHIIRNGHIDSAGTDDGGGIQIYPTTALGGGEFGVKVYNNMILNPAYAGISANTTDRVSIWNNSIYGNKTSVSVPPYGLKFLNTNTNLVVQNNIVNVTGGNGSTAMDVHADSLTGNTFDYTDIYRATAFSCASSATPAAVRWGVTGYDGNKWASTGGTCYTSLAAFQSANPTVEVHGISADPLFVNTSASPPDLHLQFASPAKDAGADLSANFTRDYDGQPRPIGAAYDIGADEYMVTDSMSRHRLLQRWEERRR